MILVKVGKLNEKVTEMALENGTTVRDALRKALVNFDPSREDIEIHGVGVVPSTRVVSSGDLIIVIPKKKDRLVGAVADMLDAEFGVDLDLDNQNDYDSVVSLIKLIKER